MSECGSVSVSRRAEYQNNNQAKGLNPIIFARTKTIHVPNSLIVSKKSEIPEDVVYSIEEDGSLKHSPLPTIEEVEEEPTAKSSSCFKFWLHALWELFCTCDNNVFDPENEWSNPLITSPGTPVSATETPTGPLLEKQLPIHEGKKTLVLDLDETLVHSTFQETADADCIIPVTIEDNVYNVYVYVRPGAIEFIKQMSAIYEVIVYTASLNIYAGPLLDLMDPEGLIAARLYRDSCVCSDGVFVKDLGLLGRELCNVLMIDNAAASFKYQPSNGIECTAFIDDKNDTELLDMIPFLKYLACQDDVRLFTHEWSDRKAASPVVALE